MERERDGHGRGMAIGRQLVALPCLDTGMVFVLPMFSGANRGAAPVTSREPEAYHGHRTREQEAGRAACGKFPVLSPAPVYRGAALDAAALLAWRA